jgi:iron-sulfur cluster assembly accessory protein
MITATESAVKHLRQLLESRISEEGVGLRLMVQRGGCAGMEYAMKLDTAGQKDQVFDQNGVRLIVDPESMDFLDGSQIDYRDTLADSGFRVENPRASRSCGCGSSFEPRSS